MIFLFFSFFWNMWKTKDYEIKRTCIVAFSLKQKQGRVMLLPFHDQVISP